MKLFTYLRYFFYLAVNWNIRIAFFIVWHEIKGESCYKINTTGVDELHTLEDNGIDTSHASIYMPAVYALLYTIFRQLPAQRGHFVDMGCGKGRALCVAAHHGFAKVTGIDFSKTFCDKARKNLSITKQTIPFLDYKVINNDAFYFKIPGDVDCVFFYNPFDEIIMSGVIENILQSLKDHPRNIAVVYINPLFKNLFIEAGFTEIYHTTKLKYMELSIFSWKN